MRHNFLEYAELMLFLLVAMTYINALDERQVFDALRAWLIRKGFGFRALFWMTGTLAFFISPVADNLTTALLMCAVVLAVGGEQPRASLPWPASTSWSPPMPAAPSVPSATSPP